MPPANALRVPSHRHGRLGGSFGYFSIAFLLGYLRRNTTLVFIVYRILLGVALLVLLSRGILTP